MAKKTSKPVQTTAQTPSAGKIMKPVRLDVTAEDYDRLIAAADRLGLTMAGYARMALKERLARDERDAQ